MMTTSDNWKKRSRVGQYLEDFAGEGREEVHRQQLLKKGLLEPEVAGAPKDLHLSRKPLLAVFTLTCVKSMDVQPF
jgi:hypothetical protein